MTQIAKRCYSRKTVVLLVTVVLALMLAVANMAPAMLKLCLFSPVKGIVVQNGQPVVGAVIERSCEWRTKETDQTVTNERGEFSMPGIYSWLGIVQLLPHQPIIHQSIIIKYGGKDYIAWRYTKMEYGEYLELDVAATLGEMPGLCGGPIDLVCELTAETKRHGDFWGYTGLGELRTVKKSKQ